MAQDKLSHDEALGKVVDILTEVSEEDDVAEHLDDNLFEADYLDSMGAVEALVTIEDVFGVSIAPHRGTARRDEHGKPHRLPGREAPGLGAGRLTR